MAGWARKNQSVLGDSSSPEWQKKMLVDIIAGNGEKWKVLSHAAPAFKGLLVDLEAAGYQPKSSGGFNYRPIRGGTGLSEHAFGNAIDINAAENPMQQRQPTPFWKPQSNMPANIGEIAAKHGIEWGGNWKNRPDPMHFEWKGSPDVKGLLSTAGKDAGVSALPAAAAKGPAFGLEGPQTPVPSIMNDMTPDLSKDTETKGVFDGMLSKMGEKGFGEGLDGIAKALKGNQQQDSGFLPVKGDDGSQAARFQAASQLMAQLLGPKKPRGILG